jgi:thiamine-monophosphate kinase
MGEFELLARVRERLPPPGGRVRVGSGDDAAVTVPGGATATSVDALVEGVHFSRDAAELGQIGSKALATALSDLAAMGAEPG